jgi:hypothetical protein
MLLSRHNRHTSLLCIRPAHLTSFSESNVVNLQPPASTFRLHFTFMPEVLRALEWLDPVLIAALWCMQNVLNIPLRRVSHASMWEDLQLNRKTEIHYLNGEVLPLPRAERLVVLESSHTARTLGSAVLAAVSNSRPVLLGW